MRFSGRVALVTGAGSGLGRATAIALAAEGAAVLLAARRDARLQEVAHAIGGEGGRALARATDVRDDDSIRTAVAAAVEEFGRLDVVVNAAGAVPEWTPVQETPDELWEEALAVNLSGPFRVIRAALPHLTEYRGSIVNVGSISAVRARHSVASYAAAKAGLIALTRCVAAEVGWQGVRCNCVVPSWIDSPMTESFLADPAARADVASRHMLPRTASADEVARAVLYLASEDASFVTGTALAVDGGMSAL